jgi:hypothetical protein
MTQIDVRLGTDDDVDTAVSIYERSNLARRHGDWPSRPSRVARVKTSLHDPTSWFLIGLDGAEAIAMAFIRPYRTDGGTGDGVPGIVFLSLIYVLPERWGMGIGGTILDAVIIESPSELGSRFRARR